MTCEMTTPGFFSWNELMTTDVAGAKAFYGQLLGWTMALAALVFGLLWRRLGGFRAARGDWLALLFMEVTFTFAPDRPITGDPLYEPGKIHHLTLTGGGAPGPRFVARYGLRPGKTLPCLLRTIRQGTCTPVLFHFPGLDLTQKPE